MENSVPSLDGALPEFPPFQESFESFLASFGIELPDAQTQAGTSSVELPSASQTGLNMLRPDLRTAYGLAWAYAKGTRAAASLPNWPVLIAQEASSLTPEITAERMKAHFDAFFASVPASGNAPPPPRRASLTGSPERSGRSGDSSCSPVASTAVGSSSLGSPASPSAASADSSKSSRTPALSNAARLAMRGCDKGLARSWIYWGLFRWDDGLSAEQAVTFEEIERAKTATGKKAAGAKGVSKYPDLRERWECKRCGRLRHEVVGHTTNLTKHVKSCSGTRGA
ncbi:hypothetical protein OC834_005252 [Tilletia horrida]|nr:hypothetical protein OC834_005252 [Tilletia horrida]